MITEKKPSTSKSTDLGFAVSRLLPQFCQCAYYVILYIYTYCCAVPKHLLYHCNPAIATALIPLSTAPTSFSIRYKFTFYLLGFSGNLSYRLARNAALHLTPIMNQDYSSGKRVYAFIQNILKYESYYVDLQAKDHCWHSL